MRAGHGSNSPCSTYAAITCDLSSSARLQPAALFRTVKTPEEWPFGSENDESGLVVPDDNGHHEVVAVVPTLVMPSHVQSAVTSPRQRQRRVESAAAIG